MARFERLSALDGAPVLIRAYPDPSGDYPMRTAAVVLGCPGRPLTTWPGI